MSDERPLQLCTYSAQRTPVAASDAIAHDLPYCSTNAHTCCHVVYLPVNGAAGRARSISSSTRFRHTHTCIRAHARTCCHVIGLPVDSAAGRALQLLQVNEIQAVGGLAALADVQHHVPVRMGWKGIEWS